jgi:small-conductance mechanosensitive channel
MNMENIANALKDWGITHGLTIIGIIVAVLLINRFIKIGIAKVVEKAVTNKGGELSKEAEEKREATLTRILSGTARILVWIFAIMMILSEIGVNIGPLIAGAGVIGLAVGFGGQYLVKDIVTGLFIIIENQYRVGDAVEIAGLSGTVEDISLRDTVLRDLDGVVHYIPHGEITTVSNKSHGFSRVNVDIGIGYGADINKAAEIINEVGNKLAEDEQWKHEVVEAPYFLRVQELGDSAVVLKIIGDTRPSRQFAVAGEIRKRVKEAFDKEGIEIPFPQMVVHKPEA